MSMWGFRSIIGHKPRSQIISQIDSPRNFNKLLSWLGTAVKSHVCWNVSKVCNVDVIIGKYSWTRETTSIVIILTSYTLHPQTSHLKYSCVAWPNEPSFHKIYATILTNICPCMSSLSIFRLLPYLINTSPLRSSFFFLFSHLFYVRQSRSKCHQQFSM